MLKKIIIFSIPGLIFLGFQEIKEKGNTPKLSWTEGQRGWIEDGYNLWTAVFPLPNYNVGIGTSNPSQKLEVNGNIKANLIASVSDEQVKVLTFTPTSDIGISNTSFVKIHPNFSITLNLPTSAKVMILFSPPVVVDVNAATQIIFDIDINNDRIGTEGSGIYMRNATVSGAWNVNSPIVRVTTLQAGTYTISPVLRSSSGANINIRSATTNSGSTMQITVIVL